MSYYKKNREVLKKHTINIITKVEKKKQLNIIKKIKKTLKKKEGNKHKNMSEDEKNVIRERSKNR